MTPDIRSIDYITCAFIRQEVGIHGAKLSDTDCQVVLQEIQRLHSNSEFHHTGVYWIANRLAADGLIQPVDEPDSSHRETYQLLDASTCHITQDDCLKLGEAKNGNRLVLYPFEYGFVLWLLIPDDELEETLLAFRDDGYSAMFCSLVREAIARGCTWLKLDRDGPIYDDLQRVEW